MKIISTSTIERFLECPRKRKFYLQSPIIELGEYYEYVKRGMVLSAFQWSILYHGVRAGKRPSLKSFLVQYRDRAWDGRPKNIAKGSKRLTIETLRGSLIKETPDIWKLVLGALRKKGKYLACNVEYELDGFRDGTVVKGSVDGVMLNGNGQLVGVKVINDSRNYRYDDLVYLDAIGIEQVFGKKPARMMLMDVSSYTTISLRSDCKTDIIKEVNHLVNSILDGAMHKTPSDRCNTCPYRQICINTN